MLLDELQNDRMGFSIAEVTPGPLCHLSKLLIFLFLFSPSPEGYIWLSCLEFSEVSWPNRNRMPFHFFSSKLRLKAVPWSSSWQEFQGQLCWHQRRGSRSAWHKAGAGQRGKKVPSSIKNSFCCKAFCKASYNPGEGSTLRGEKRDPFSTRIPCSLLLVGPASTWPVASYSHGF